MKRYSLFFCDIDGTLLDDHHRIDDETKAKIKAVTDSGIGFILVSSRVPVSVIPIADALGIRMPIICAGGGLILDEDRSILFEAAIEKSTAIAVKALTQKNWPQVSCHIYSRHLWIVDSLSEESTRLEKIITGAVATEGDPDKLLEEGAPVHKMLVRGDTATLEEIYGVIKKTFPQLHPSFSHNHCLEFMHSSAKKSLGIAFLCRKYGIDPADTASVGNNHNDIDMLKFTGLGVAMDNAPDAVKKIAGHTTKSNNDQGVLALLNKLYPDI
ncbi:MAG: Cof-type HAD-IIB family hydrolase [Christensenellales bacterium]|jgi:Cof subfamily protein (haloacid dehalogenase superfamily)